METGWAPLSLPKLILGSHLGAQVQPGALAHPCPPHSLNVLGTWGQSLPLCHAWLCGNPTQCWGSAVWTCPTCWWQKVWCRDKPTQPHPALTVWPKESKQAGRQPTAAASTSCCKPRYPTFLPGCVSRCVLPDGQAALQPLGLLGGRCLPWLQLTRRSRHKVQGLHWVQEWSSYGCKAQGCNLFNRLHFNQSSVLFFNSQYDLECLLWYKVGFGKVFKTLSYIHMVIMLLLELREVGMIWTSNIMIFLIRTVEMTLSCYRMVPNTVNMKL